MSLKDLTHDVRNAILSMNHCCKHGEHAHCLAERIRIIKALDAYEKEYYDGAGVCGDSATDKGQSTSKRDILGPDNN